MILRMNGILLPLSLCAFTLRIADNFMFSTLNIIYFSFYVIREKFGPNHVTVEFYRSHTIRQTDTHTIRQTHTDAQPIGLLWKSEQPETEVATYTTHNEQKGRTSMQSAGFETVIPAFKRFQTHVF